MTPAAAYAARLLSDLGISPKRPLAADHEHPAIAWAQSGLMALTGRPDGEPQMCPVPLASCADGALAALACLAPARAFEGLRGSQLLSERAAIAGYSRRGSVSPGGSCRLLPSAKGWIALNLVRPEDWALIPAWLETPGEIAWSLNPAANWNLVQRAIQDKPAQELVERGRLMGLAVCASEAPAIGPASWFSTAGSSSRRMPGSSDFKALDTGFRRYDGDAINRDSPVVVDLSSLWAGPLCSHLLQRLGALVIKVESAQRPDGARRGPAAFFDLLNAGKLSVALDPGTKHGREQLQALLRKADIVIEASRPRALRQLGIDADTMVLENPGLTWISITGYGRSEPQENWVAYGDDAGVAAGLSQLLLDASDQPLIGGDAIADPLTGLHAALAAWAGFQRGGGGLISLPLREVVAHCIAFDLPATAEGMRNRCEDWTQLALDQGGAQLPIARTAAGAARPLGADTAAVFSDWRIAA